jgi:hypothetical protein
MVSNQDGLGSGELPRSGFPPGAGLRAAAVPPRRASASMRSSSARTSRLDNCECRKPRTGHPAAKFLASHALRPQRQRRHRRPGDRPRAGREHRRARPAAWTPRDAACLGRASPTNCWTCHGRASVPARNPRDAHRLSSIDLDAEQPPAVHTGIGFFDHMLEQIGRHGGFALTAATARATCRSTSTTRSRTRRWSSARRCASALGDKRGIGALRLRAADGRGTGTGCHSTCPGAHTSVFEGKPFRAAEVGRAAHRDGAAFLPLAGRQPRCANLHITGDAATTPTTWSKPVSRRRAVPCARPSRARVPVAAQHQGHPVSAAAREVVIIDGGGANIASLTFALQRLGLHAHADHGCMTAIRAGLACDPPGRRCCPRRDGHALPEGRPRPLIPTLTAAAARHLPRHAAVVRSLGGGRGRAASA